MTYKKTIIDDAIEPNLVPPRTLYTGAKMPGIGMGTFGSDHITAEQVADAVKGAMEVGYRLFDCASVYENEHLIGNVLADATKMGVKRDELFIISKVWNDMHGKRDVLLSCVTSLLDLKLDYIDLFVVHWPFRNFHPKGAATDYRNHDARPYDHEKYMETWYQMERLVEMGLVNHIGTSNMTVPKLKLVMRDARIKPAANEMELHPCFQQPELFNYCIDNKIQPIGFCPIGSPARPDRDKTIDDVVDTEDPIVIEIAKAYNVHPAIICIKWAFQRGQIPIPFSISRNKYLSNIRCVVEDLLADEEMKKLEAADKNCRLIKGQVFLWEGAADWRDLWDLNGEIIKG